MECGARLLPMLEQQTQQGLETGGGMGDFWGLGGRASCLPFHRTFVMMSCAQVASLV